MGDVIARFLFLDICRIDSGFQHDIVVVHRQVDVGPGLILCLREFHVASGVGSY